MERLISKYMKKWLRAPNSLTNVALYSSSTKLKLLTFSLVEEFDFSKAQLIQTLHDSHNPLMKNTQPSVITVRKWKVKIAVENAVCPTDERNNWQCSKWKSRPRPSSTALVVQGIHDK